jgi:uroporphyrin-III C-methyltransferase
MDKLDASRKGDVTSSPDKGSVASEKQRGSGAGLFSFFVVLVIIVIVVGGYFFWQHSDQNKHLIVANQHQIEQIQQEATQLSTLQGQLTQQTQALATQKALIGHNQSTIGHIVTSLGSNQDGWLVNEAEHFIKIANVMLRFEHNVPSAILLLQAADRQLYMADDPDLFPARKKIADDVAQLQAAPKIDVVGIYLRLQSIKEQAVHLSLVKNHFSGDMDKNLVHQKTKNGFWSGALNETSKALSKVLVVRHRTRVIDPLITPKQHIVLSQNMYLLFSQAQWSVLHRNNKIYQASLAQLSQWLNSYFVANTASVHMITALRALQKINVAPVLPDISDALDALKQFKALKQKKALLKPNKKQPVKNKTARPTSKQPKAKSAKVTGKQAS